MSQSIVSPKYSPKWRNCTGLGNDDELLAEVDVVVVPLDALDALVSLEALMGGFG
jgi:hypothetical protein